MRISNERLEKIKSNIVNILNLYRINIIPINVFEIASKMKIKIVPYSKFKKEPHILELHKKMSMDGYFIEKQDGTLFIFYNDYINNSDRINNTIAHEIGHIVLDHKIGNEIEESEASFFAKYLLAPPPLIDKLQITNYWEIENIFNISSEASQYAWNYYKKWLKYGGSNYTDYELELLQLFKNSIHEIIKQSI